MDPDRQLRILALRCTEVAQDIRDAQRALPSSAAALARISTCALLLGGMIKGREQVSIQIRHDGPLGELYAIADANGHVRATVHQPFLHLPLDAEDFRLAGLVGNGTISVTRSLGLKEPQQGTVPLVAGEIVQDLVHYFAMSEQKPTAMGAAERVTTESVSVAGGFLIQAFPDAPDSLLAQVEQTLATMPSLVSLLEAGNSAQDLAQAIIPGAIVLEEVGVAFRCSCDRDRYQRILLTLGVDDLAEMAADESGTELVCNYCNTAYQFSQTEIQALLEEARSQ